MFLIGLRFCVLHGELTCLSLCDTEKLLFSDAEVAWWCSG